MKNLLLVRTSILCAMGVGSVLHKFTDERSAKYLRIPNNPSFLKSVARPFQLQVAYCDDNEDNRLPSRPYIGCSIRSVEDRPGMLILIVNSESPAAKSKLKSGDIILEINGKPVNNIKEYNAAVGSEKGIALHILIEREGETKEVVVQCA